jgi:hypothetical protein
VSSKDNAWDLQKNIIFSCFSQMARRHQGFDQQIPLPQMRCEALRQVRFRRLGSSSHRFLLKEDKRDIFYDK